MSWSSGSATCSRPAEWLKSAMVNQLRSCCSSRIVNEVWSPIGRIVVFV